VYLAKDSVMREASFKSTYSKWQEFEVVRKNYGAIGKFASNQSRRLGLE
jgi:decaprenylphospho-beta-D-ribofuranose 2-oxidase